MSRTVAFLTDYGPGSEHVGALHAVVATACSDAVLIDLAHDLPPGDVRWAALVLARLMELAPAAIVCAVVDPGVGTDRRAVAVALDGGGALVGPDNGLLGPAARRFGATAAAQITSPAVLRDPVAPTFHGRDVFAPAAAHLAGGGALSDLGPALDPNTIEQPQLPAPNVSTGAIEALAVGSDRFGNVALLAGQSDLAAAGLAHGDPVWVTCAEHRFRARVGRVFADAPRGGLLVHVDSSGSLALAVNGGSAVERLGLAPGEAIGIQAMGE